MLNLQRRLPGKSYPYWLRIDYDTLLSNIAGVSQKASLLDMAMPFLHKIWSHIEDDLIRLGIKGVLSNNPQTLLAVSGALQKILRPNYRPGEAGYAHEGLLPVLGSYSDCLNLSNIAQNHDCRIPFLLRSRARSGEYGAGDWGLDSICEQLQNVPMIDLHGFYFLRQPEPSETSPLRRYLRRLEAHTQMFVMPISVMNSDFKEASPFIDWETVALENAGPGCFPVEAGFWAYPVHAGSDYQIFQADLGSLQGLPYGEFPVQIGGISARLHSLQPEYSEFVVDGQLPGPFPVAGFLTGGRADEPVDLHQWKPTELKSLLAHFDNCPVYLQKNGRTFEICG